MPRSLHGHHAAASIETQRALVNHLINDGVVKHQNVADAMLATDRKYFCPRNIPLHYAYQDSPLPIGHGETISAPHMHGTCLELLHRQLRPGARVLDVGSGSGYLSAVMGIMVRPNGKVIGIEKHPELAELGEANIRDALPDLLSSGTIEMRAGNVLGDALQSESGFDAIHVGAAAETLPKVLVEKLLPGGRMVIPVGPQWDYQVMQVVDRDKDSGEVRKHDLMGVRYVPLTKPSEDVAEETNSEESDAY